VVVYESILGTLIQTLEQLSGIAFFNCVNTPDILINGSRMKIEVLVFATASLTLVMDLSTRLYINTKVQSICTLENDVR